MPRLSKRLDDFQPSTIAEIFALAATMKEQGIDVVDLSSGEPDFATPAHICEAGKRAIDEGVTKYTAVDGTTDLKRAVQGKFKHDNGLHYTLDEIVIDAGAKPIIAHALMAILNEGDEVIIPAPCWASHPGAVRLCGGVPVIVPGDRANGFKPRASDLEGAITARTRAVIINSPANPTGAVLSAQELEQISRVLTAHSDIWVIADDIYEKLLFDGREFASICQVAPELGDRTITINGLSKAFAMTGWRIGYAGGPRNLMAAIRAIMSQATGNPCAISQAAAVTALESGQSFMAGQVAIYQARRDRLVRELNRARGLEVKPCEGAFYLYVECAGVLGKRLADGREIASSSDFARYLLEQYQVAVVPGAAFEYDPYFRLSFAAADAELDKAGDRIVAACAALE